MRFVYIAVLAVMVCAGSRAMGAPPNDKGVTSPPTYEIGCPIPEKRVAVMQLNVEGRYSEQVREWLPALIEDRLLRQGWTLVVRGERMQHIQDEKNLPGVKPETKLPENELLGATAFLELNCRTQVKDIQGAVGYKMFTVGDFARASVDLNGQVVDPATGVLKSSVYSSGSASGIKTALAVTINSDWRIGAGGYNLEGNSRVAYRQGCRQRGYPNGRAADRSLPMHAPRRRTSLPCRPCSRRRRPSPLMPRRPLYSSACRAKAPRRWATTTACTGLIG